MYGHLICSTCQLLGLSFYCMNLVHSNVIEYRLFFNVSNFDCKLLIVVSCGISRRYKCKIFSSKIFSSKSPYIFLFYFMYIDHVKNSPLIFPNFLKHNMTIITNIFLFGPMLITIRKWCALNPTIKTVLIPLMIHKLFPLIIEMQCHVCNFFLMDSTMHTLCMLL